MTLFLGRFSRWAVLDVAVGRFGQSENLWAVLVGAGLVHGPFCYRRIRSVQRGLGQSPRSWEIFENVCAKVNLTVCKVTFRSLTVSYRKNWGAEYTSCYPNNLLGEHIAPPVPPVPAPMGQQLSLCQSSF